METETLCRAAAKFMGLGLTAAEWVETRAGGSLYLPRAKHSLRCFAPHTDPAQAWELWSALIRHVTEISVGNAVWVIATDNNRFVEVDVVNEDFALTLLEAVKAIVESNA